MSVVGLGQRWTMFEVTLKSGGHGRQRRYEQEMCANLHGNGCDDHGAVWQGSVSFNTI